MENYYQELVETIDYFYTRAALESREKFKETEMKLLKFTRSEDAWEGCFTMLNQPDLNEFQMLFAANTLKSKMIFDYSALKSQNSQVAEKFGEELVKMIKNLLSEGTKKPSPVVINSLCLSLAIFCIHQNEFPEIDTMLNSNIDEVWAMFTVLKYLSEETYLGRIVL